MPIIKSAIKRTRQAEKRRSHNLAVKRAVKQDVRSFVDAVEKKDTKAVQETFRAAVSEIDRAVKKGTLHKNTAGRRKSQLSRLAASVGAPAKAKPKTAAPKASTKKPAAKKPAAKK